MTTKFRLAFVAVLLTIAGCQTTAEQTPFAATLPSTAAATRVLQQNTPIPTANLQPSRTPTLPPTPTLTPSNTPTITPSPTITPTLTATPIPPTTTPIASATPTDPADDPNNTPEPTWTPPPANPAAQLADHYVFARPIGEGGVNWANRVYPYGATAGGRFRPHHGIDLENPVGTPILAAGDGVVYYAGPDIDTLFGPQPDFYGRVVVIQHNITTPDGQPVFTLYGHMDTFRVETGQSVTTGTQIGTVGGTGIALGPHLHFEVRVGDPHDYGSTRNPELWIRPYPTFGTLAGVIRDANGTLLAEAPLRIESTDISRFAFSYINDTVNPDSVFNENFVLGDLPANYYQVTVSDNGRVRFRQIVYIYPNRTTWLDITLSP
ncbi:MAG: peptidoglycan DD-metalloendopeptidase family protein [Anaerolineae bacterium]|nr:peptidoglycan DD-metalloendopeptidase family protein [Anaerolineae bacterium]